MSFLKIFDFGLDRTTNERGTNTASGVKGTQDYIAPELLKLIDSDSDDENEILACEYCCSRKASKRITSN